MSTWGRLVHSRERGRRAAREQRSRGARERGSRGAEEQRNWGAGVGARKYLY